VYSYANVKIIIILFLLSIAAFISHRVGLMDTELSVLIKTSENPKKLINSDAVYADLKDMTLLCQLTDNKNYNYCGLGIAIGDGNIQQGFDLSEFTRLALSIEYSTPNPTDKLKITFRNYDNSYSNIDDEVSLKFNSIIYNPNLNESIVNIPLKALKVDDWWIEQYNISFNDSQVDLSNVSYIEIITESMKALGEYRIQINNIFLYGQIISEANLLKLMLVIWLIIAILLVTLQRNKLKKMSITDPLTGLYNRQGISFWTQKKMLLHFNSHQLYLFYLDLDDFKKVNDTYGHQVGDQLLIALSEKIKSHLKNTLNQDFAFARISGDEFTIVIDRITETEVDKLADSLLSILDIPIKLKSSAIYARASLGIAEFNRGASTFEGILARADSAMYYAKKEGKNNYKVFNKSISTDIFFRKQTAEKLLDAITRNEFQIHFMPIVDANSLETVSVEVLLRNTSLQLKGIGPDVFIPIAEEFNLIKQIDLWVIDATFKQIAKEITFLNQTILTFCINISAIELHNPLFVEQLKSLLEHYKISPSLIELELTETSLIETDLMSITTLKAINALGIKLALDDFGTGYTAFSQLINYPVDCLKIDKSFIDGVSSSDNTKSTMIKAIISIADSYQLKTIGEGVEDVKQYEFLVEHGCDMIQGYLFAKPMNWNDLKELINDPTVPESRRLKLI